MGTYIVGVHDGHNASACILADGRIQFAIQEERLGKEKNYVGFPSRAIRACLSYAGIRAGDVATVAFASYRSTPVRSRAGEQLAAVRREATLQGMVRRVLWHPAYRLCGHMGRMERLKQLKQCGFRQDQYADYEHHACHAAAVYHGLRADLATTYLVITVDGYGDLDSSTIWVSREGMLERIARTPFSHSLGTIYATTTGMMGFRPLEHEYKLMGMAPYASAKHAQRLVESFHRLMAVDERNMRFQRRTITPTFLYARRIRNMIAGERFDVVCAALQQFTEEMLQALVRSAVRHTGIGRLLCAGGVFMNVKANKRLLEMPEVESLSIFPSCGDETLCMGAAYLGYASTAGPLTTRPISDFYMGTDIDDGDSCREVVSSCRHEVRYHEDIEAEVVRVLAAGKPVARCKGRMEFGARALGNRSILADPVNQDVVRVINRMVKNRDFWMPFAPAVRRERAHDYFAHEKDVSSPYMMLTFDTRENVRDLIAAVHNADLTARPQLVEAHQNPDFYRLLQLFEEYTGRGALLNTSFNLHGFPIVNTARQAIAVFEQTGLEFLSLGNYLVHKKSVLRVTSRGPGQADMAADA